LHLNRGKDSLNSSNSISGLTALAVESAFPSRLHSQAAPAAFVAGIPRGFCIQVNAMRYEFREGDWVRHYSCAKPVRVIGIGTTIAVQLPNGTMQAFEPCELEKVAGAKVAVKVHVHEHRQVRRLGSAKWLGFIASFSLLCLITLVLMAIAGARP
jgi:hypothetical protein